MLISNCKKNYVSKIGLFKNRSNVSLFLPLSIQSSFLSVLFITPLNLKLMFSSPASTRGLMASPSEANLPYLFCFQFSLVMDFRRKEKMTCVDGNLNALINVFT